mgnify:CR=1 FL=1
MTKIVFLYTFMWDTLYFEFTGTQIYYFLRAAVLAEKRILYKKIFFKNLNLCFRSCKDKKVHTHALKVQLCTLLTLVMFAR